MPFINFIDAKNALWAAYGYEMLAFIMLIVSCICVVCCDNLECAILIVQLLTMVYCCLWVMAIVQMYIVWWSCKEPIENQ